MFVICLSVSSSSLTVFTHSRPKDLWKTRCMLPSHVVLFGFNLVLVLLVTFNITATHMGLWYPKSMCSTRAPQSIGDKLCLTRAPQSIGDKLCSTRAPQSIGGPVILPLHGPSAAHVWSEPTLGGSPSAPYRQGLCQVSPTNGHPPEAQV